MEIIHKNNDEDGIFIAEIHGERAGLMTYTWENKTQFIIDHTEVEEAFNGKGVGKELVHAAVDYARKNNFKIIPHCSFARAVLNKTPEFNDVLV